MSTALFAILKKQIQAHGPLTVADYMAQCLMHPKHGYYQQQKVFGVEGDFITAPEVSQIFGEMIGLWLVDRWQAMGCPNPVTLVELGPGRGTLMADILRVTKAVPGFHQAIALTMVELSTDLRKKQRQAVKPFGFIPTHLSSLMEVTAKGPLLVIGNEFIDALPIHQFVKQQGSWLERVITLNEEETGLAYALTPAGKQLHLMNPALGLQARDGDVVELCPAGLSTIADLAALLSQNGGDALLIDYGYTDHKTGDSFQALKHHAYADALAEPGLADLTAHVNFKALADAAQEKGLVVSGPTEQGSFLMALGAGQRAMQLAKNKDSEAQKAILSGLKRLTAPDEMGQLFKVIALSTHMAPSPGF